MRFLGLGLRFRVAFRFQGLGFQFRVTVQGYGLGLRLRVLEVERLSVGVLPPRRALAW